MGFLHIPLTLRLLSRRRRRTHGSSDEITPFSELRDEGSLPNYVVLRPGSLVEELSPVLKHVEYSPVPVPRPLVYYPLSPFAWLLKAKFSFIPSMPTETPR